jgi:hypothetical protein
MHENKWEAKLALKAIVFPHIKVFPLGYGFICNNTFGVDQNKKTILSYNWRLLNLQLHGFYHNDGKLIHYKGDKSECNVSTFITFYNLQYIVSNWKSSFILQIGVGMKSNI